MFFSVVRVGEASHPGPDDASDNNFVLGCANPSGLRSKACYVVEHMSHGDVWAMSETHLSSKEVNSFNSGLHFAQSSFCPLLGGYPVPPSRDNTGSWRGVGILSKTPVRHIPNSWPDEIACSSRVMAFTTLVDDLWLTGGVVYGEPDSHHYPHRLMHNEALLQAVIGSVGFLMQGPRFIAGDWNVSSGELPAFDTLEGLGFRDLQDIAFERWGIVPQPTCKTKTRKDFCFVSPELQALLVQVDVLHDVWPDHAVVQGTFKRLKNSVPRDVWKMPAEFPWPSQWEIDPFMWDSLGGLPDAKYSALWQAIEDSASHALPYAVARNTKGRAMTKSVSSVVPGTKAPIRVGRRGDFQPQFHCCSFRHAQWVRQVRRLQAFVRARSNAPLPSHYACGVWAAILRAPGFAGGFTSWWESCPDKVHGSPAFVPWFPPEAIVATKIFESLAINLRSMEAQLVSCSRQYARMRREKNPNVIFRDLKSPPVNAVDYLIKPVRSVVEEVRPESLELVLASSQQWDMEKPIICNGLPLEVIHAERDCLWVANASDIQPGDAVVQIQCSGSKEDLESAFVDEWKSRWDRHRNVPEDRWNTILAFARVFLPRRQLEWPSITPEVLTALISAKKDSSACGLDGVSVHDLKCMPPSVVHNFTRLFQSAEQDGSWPSQLLVGKVACLAKVEHPSSVLDYRPITILGMLYRLWGSYHARKAIRQLDQFLPDTLYGSRHARSAGQVWSQLLWVVEDSTVHGVALSGLIADLQKAFNHLPRSVVFEAAAIMGVPMKVLIAWAGALASIGRRFQLGQHLSCAVYSATGLPEGDGLSCLGMLVVDVLFHAWHQHFFPLCQPISYVDDWTILVTDPRLMQGAFHCLSKFTDAMDLLLDTRKTFVWSTSGQGRQCLRDQGFRVETSCRLLGAHVQTSKKHTNATQVDRVNSLHSLWPKLRLSAAAYDLKLRAIRSAAWPKGLHAIAATTVSHQIFKSLRSGAMRGLQADGSGSNSMVHLGLIERSITDPQFWAIMQTFRMVRDCGVATVVHGSLFDLVQGNERYARNGISATLLVRIQTLGWHIPSPECLADDFGSFSLFDVSIEELQWRMEHAWLKVVASSVAHRPGLAELERIDPVRTRQWLSKLKADDRAAYRKLLNGSHITQDGKHYCQESDTGVCLYCECSDSRFHRFWGCEAFSDCRGGVSPQLWEAIPHLPECVTCYGWALKPTTAIEWFQHLHSLLPCAVPTHPWPTVELVHAFTDGSCSFPTLPDVRHAAFAIVLADPCMVAPAVILESGPLPGIRQTSVRAELFAVHRAVKFAACRGVSLMLWSDCQSVVRRLRRILMGAEVKLNSPNSDLWTLISDDIHGGGCSVQVTKIAAHRSIASACSPLEEWGFVHNGFADRAAASANQARGAEFWDILARHSQACLTVDHWNAMIQTVLLQISRRVLHAGREKTIQAEPLPPRHRAGVAYRQSLSFPLELYVGMGNPWFARLFCGFGLLLLRILGQLFGSPTHNCLLTTS